MGLADQLQQAYTTRFAVKPVYARTLKFDPSEPRDARGRWIRVGDRITALKAKYPEVAFNYPRSTYTEMGSIEAHTKDVGREWEKQLSPEDMAGLSERFGSDVQKLMASTIALHDIGKAQAIESGAGGKDRQHEYTTPIMQKVLRQEGFSEKDVTLATELTNHDLIGPLFRGYEGFSANEADVVTALRAKAKTVGMGVSDFVTLQLAFYQADASAYPYITRFMRQEPSGKWTFQGHKKIAAIEALIQKREYVREPAGSPKGGEFARVPLEASQLAQLLHVQTVSKDGARELGVHSELEKIITPPKWTETTPGVHAAYRGLQAGMAEMLQEYPDLKTHVFVGYMNNDAFGQAITASAAKRTDNAIVLIDTHLTPEEVLQKAQGAQIAEELEHPDIPNVPRSLAYYLATTNNALSNEQRVEAIYKGIAIHEFGHVVDAFQAHQRLGAPIGQRQAPNEVLGTKIHELMVEQGHGSGSLKDAEWRADWIKKNLSAYAWDGGPPEAFAEAFLAKHVGRLPAGLQEVMTTQSSLKQAAETRQIPADMQAWMKRRPKDWLDFSDAPPVLSIAKFAGVLKFDPSEPRNPKGTAEGGRWVSTGGRTFTSEEGYQWHEQGPVAEWAKALPYRDSQAIGGYSGFGYHAINDLRRGTFEVPTKSYFVRAATPEEMRRVGWDVEKNEWVPSIKVKEGEYKPGYPVDPRDAITPESIARFGHPMMGKSDPREYDPNDPYHRVDDGRIVINQYYRPVEGGPTMMFSIQRVGPDLERLQEVQHSADVLDDLIRNRGYVLPEPITVERGAYLPGVTFEQLQDMQYEGPNGEPPLGWEEKGFTSTMVGEADRRAKSYPALGKYESLYNRYHDRMYEHQDEVGTAVRFHIMLPAGTKVAAVEPVRRLDYEFPRIPNPSPRPSDVLPEYWTTRDYAAKPTVDATRLQDKNSRSESELLLGSGARFRVIKTYPGYTYGSEGDPKIHPVQVREVWLEYTGGGSSDGTVH